MSVMAKDSRQARYAKLCSICASGRDPVRREVTPGVSMWLHDSIATCGAHKEREQDKDRDAIKTQKS
jgi:hypothetical protein